MKATGRDVAAPGDLRYVPTPAQQELAGWLWQHERAVDGHHKPGGPLEPTEQVLRRLSPGVTALVTTAGYRALLSRALRLARTEFPLLDGVAVGTVGAYIDGRRVAGAGVSEDSVVAFIGALIGLLATFIGDDLTDNLIRDTWPEAPLRGTASGSGGTR